MVEQWTVNPLVASSNLAPGDPSKESLVKNFIFVLTTFLSATVYSLEAIQPVDTMKKAEAVLQEKKIVGIKVRTNNQREMDPLKGRILPCLQKYFHQNLAVQIPNRVNPGTTYCIYTDYESDHQGDYTYFVGEEVSSFENVPLSLETTTIPQQKYIKFTNGPGAMPDVVRKPWMQIWQMSSKEMGGDRSYLADFEIYDERAQDHQNIVLDIYIGVD